MEKEIIKTESYLVVNRLGVHKVLKTKPSLDWDEISIRLELSLPASLFKRPMLEARINVDESAVKPTDISPEIIINTKELIEQQTGFKFDLKVLPAEEDKKDI